MIQRERPQTISLDRGEQTIDGDKEDHKMKRGTHLGRILIIFALFYLIFPQRAYAYIDPGTGSYILQLLVATLLGGVFALKLGWNKIVTFFRRRFKRPFVGSQRHEPAKGKQ